MTLPPVIDENIFKLFDSMDIKPIEEFSAGFAEFLYSLAEVQNMNYAHSRRFCLYSYFRETEAGLKEMVGAEFIFGGHEECHIRIELNGTGLYIALGFSRLARSRIDDLDDAQLAFQDFRKVIGACLKEFDSFVVENGLKLIYQSRRTGKIVDAPSDEISSRLVDLEEPFFWLYIRKPVLRGMDRGLLETPAALKDLLERITGGFRSIWDKL